MTEENAVAEQGSQENNKEYNFRQIERKLLEERQERERLSRELEEIKAMQNRRAQSQSDDNDDDDDDEPYVDHKILQKRLNKFGQEQQKNTKNEITSAVQHAIQEERKQNWINKHGDFYDVLQKHAEKLAVKAPSLAESILKLPDNFERQQLVYNNIKALGLDEDPNKKSSIQNTVDSRRQGAYYQPSSAGSSAYNMQGDFSKEGQKSAYDKMIALQNRLSIG